VTFVQGHSQLQQVLKHIASHIAVQCCMTVLSVDDSLIVKTTSMFTLKGIIKTEGFRAPNVVMGLL
jgi:hypothetical protein